MNIIQISENFGIMKGRVAIICGNSVDNNLIWVMDWNSGENCYAILDRLFLRKDRKSLTESAIEKDSANGLELEMLMRCGFWLGGMRRKSSKINLVLCSVIAC